MNVENLLMEIEDEIAQLTKVAEALRGLHPKGHAGTKRVILPKKRVKAFTMSAEARAKIGAATRARWAALKKAKTTK